MLAYIVLHILLNVGIVYLFRDIITHRGVSLYLERAKKNMFVDRGIDLCNGIFYKSYHASKVPVITPKGSCYVISDVYNTLLVTSDSFGTEYNPHSGIPKYIAYSKSFFILVFDMNTKDRFPIISLNFECEPDKPDKIIDPKKHKYPLYITIDSTDNIDRYVKPFLADNPENCSGSAYNTSGGIKPHPILSQYAQHVNYNQPSEHTCLAR
jgi:hypothetical protein